MQTRVLIVALQMVRDSKSYEAFRESSFQERMNLLEARIRNVCHQLQQVDEKAKWIIVWNEHGINGAEPQGYLSSARKKLFKEAMCSLTSEYPQLAIIAGTVKSGKYYLLSNDNFNEKIHKINAAYAANEWIGENEGNPSQYKKHSSNATMFSQNSTRTIVRNTAFVFTNGNCIARHDKLAPYNEINDADIIFQIGKGRSASNLVNIEYVDGVKIPVGLEICREHFIGVLQHEITLRQMKQPPIHFVLSDAIFLNSDHIAGDHIIHADTVKPITYQQVDKLHHEDVSVACYFVDAFNPESALTNVPFSHAVVKSKI